MSFQEFQTIMAALGISGGVTIAILFLVQKFLGISLLTKILENFMKFSWKRKSKVSVESNVQNHEILNLIEYWTQTKIPVINLSTPYRTLIFRDYLRIYLRTNKEHIGDFINKKDFESMDDAQLKLSIIRLYNRINGESETKMAESGIPIIVIEKMKSQNTKYSHFLFEFILKICNTELYESRGNYMKIYSILNIFSLLIQLVFTNIEQVSNSIGDDLL